MRALAVALVSGALSCAAIAAATTFGAASVGGCDDTGSDGGDAGADAACGTQTCTAAQVCLYRECSDKDRCTPAASCPSGTTPADCSGTPGCLVDNCSPILQGCRDIPATCGGDVTCACASICGSTQACSSVDGRNALCAAATQ